MHGIDDSHHLLMLSISAIRNGVPAKKLDTLSAALGITKENLYRHLKIGGSTVELRAKTGGRLNPSQSERILGLEALIDVARKSVKDLGEYRSVSAWLGDWLVNTKFGRGAPVDLLDTVTGQRLVAGLLREHGTRQKAP